MRLAYLGVAYIGSLVQHNLPPRRLRRSTWRLRRLLPPNEMSESAPVYGKKLHKCTLNNLTNPILSQSTAVMSGICNDSYGTDSCVICCKKFVDTEGPWVTIGEKGCQL